MKSSRGNSSNPPAVNTTVDKENTNPNIVSNSNPRLKLKQKYNQANEQERKEEPKDTMENNSDQMTLSSRLETIEQKLLNLQSLKDETISEFSALLTEINEIIPFLNQLQPIPLSDDSNPIDNESGLSRLLNRLQKLQCEYQKRRSVSERRFNYRVEAVKARYSAELLHNKTESESEIAETSVALIHKHMSKGHLNSSNSSSSKSSESLNNSSTAKTSVISARKRSLPAINQPVTACPPSLKMARRQSVAAYPHTQTNSPTIILGNATDRNIANSSILNLNQNIVVTPKSVADADLLAIKSRISKALKR